MRNLNQYLCENCQDECTEDFEVDGEYYCSESCLNECGYFNCSQCEDINRESEMEEINGNIFCSESCVESYGYKECNSCGEHAFESDMVEFNKDYYCNDDCLADESIYPCEECGDYIEERFSEVANSNYYCSEDCAEKDGYSKCEECGDYNETDSMIKYENSYYCNTNCIEVYECSECGDLTATTIEVHDCNYCSTVCIKDAGYVQCTQCEEYNKEDDSVKINGDYYCSYSCAGKIECIGCGKVAEAKNLLADLRSCSKECYIKAVKEKKIKKCVGCKNPYLVYESVYDKLGLCSFNCKNKYGESILTVDNFINILISKDKKYLTKLKNTDSDRYFNLIERYKFIGTNMLKFLGWNKFDNQMIFKITKGKNTYVISFSSLLVITNNNEVRLLSDFNENDNLNVLLSLFEKGFKELEVFICINDLRRSIKKFY